MLNAGINHYVRQRLGAQSTPAVRKPTSDKCPPPVAVNLLGEPPFHPSHSTSPKAQVTVRPSLLAPRLSPPPPTSFLHLFLPNSTIELEWMGFQGDRKLGRKGLSGKVPRALGASVFGSRARLTHFSQRGLTDLWCGN